MFWLEGMNPVMGSYLNFGGLLEFLSMEPDSVPLKKKSAMMVEPGKGATTNRPANLASIRVGAERPSIGEVPVRIAEAAVTAAGKWSDYTRVLVLLLLSLFVETEREEDFGLSFVYWLKRMMEICGRVAGGSQSVVGVLVGQVPENEPAKSVLGIDATSNRVVAKKSGKEPEKRCLGVPEGCSRRPCAVSWATEDAILVRFGNKYMKVFNLGLLQGGTQCRIQGR
ncbi:hypothetical protein NE237_009053 [Protea cynaroides]|uniref:Uncharacterized protein n=1 Tax=Protea cynaroides TaxID=273540 RepID=A0A9Q0KWU4_9MAGN|nr:hypothetical protein NE237_009053 [Protea cynaroides]